MDVRKLACRLGGLIVLAALQWVLAAEVFAQTDAVAAFYRGRTVQAVVGYTPGSTFELYLRTLTRHLGRRGEVHRLRKVALNRRRASPTPRCVCGSRW